MCDQQPYFGFVTKSEVHKNKASVIEKPEDYNLPNDYTFASNQWGNSFYKVYRSMTFTAAIAQCKSDGASLAFPRSEAENDFIVGLIPGQNIWIGINDIDQEGKFVSIDGQDISFTKWYVPSGQPDNWGNNEDAVHIIGRPGNSLGYWNDLPVTYSNRFVCTYMLSSKF